MRTVQPTLESYVWCGVVLVDHHGVELGNASVRLEQTGVRFRPTRLKQWRGARPVSVSYAEIAKVSMAEPRGLAPGTLTVWLRCGDTHMVSFSTSKVREMRRIQREIWQRTRAARGDGAERPMRPPD